MSAQLLTALIAGFGFLLNLLGLIVILRVKVAIGEVKIDMLNTFTAFRAEMRETYVSRELYTADHQITMQRHRIS